MLRTRKPYINYDETSINSLRCSMLVMGIKWFLSFTCIYSFSLKQFELLFFDLLLLSMPYFWPYFYLICRENIIILIISTNNIAFVVSSQGTVNIA